MEMINMLHIEVSVMTQMRNEVHEIRCLLNTEGS